MREIKFRAWDERWEIMYNNFQFIKSGDEQKDWIVFTADNIPFDSGWKNNPYLRPQLKIMQYTGLKDKNGKEIYEGDILLIDGTITGAKGFGAGFLFENLKIPVVWDSGIIGWSFDVENDERFSDYYEKEDKYSRINFRNHVRSQMFDGTAEIIGNIYQNPELLKSK